MGILSVFWIQVNPSVVYAYKLAWSFSGTSADLILSSLEALPCLE